MPAGVLNQPLPYKKSPHQRALLHAQRRKNRSNFSPKPVYGWYRKGKSNQLAFLRMDL